MPQDAFTLRRVREEIAPRIAGAKLTKLIQPDKDSVLCFLYTEAGTAKLLLSANASAARICLTRADYPAPAVAPNFCMLLRKHLAGGTIVGLEQIGFERVLALTVHCVSDFTETDRVLYIEIMGKYSNLILTENGVILGALKTTSLEENRKRVLFSGVPYAFPAPQEKVDPTSPEAIEVLASYREGDLAEFLFSRIAGIARPTAERIAESYRGGDMAAHLKEWLFSGETAPCVLYADGKPKDFFAKAVPGAVPFPSLCAAQDECYLAKEAERAFADKKRKLSAVVNAHRKKEEKKLAILVDRLRECAGAEDCRKAGELLTANLYRIRQGDAFCEAIDYADAGKSVSIRLDKTLSPAQNAQAYFKKYAKLKRTLAAVTPQKEATQRDLDYTESVLSALERASDPIDLSEIEEELIDAGLLRFQGKKRKEVVTPYRLYVCEGFRIAAGRNNRQNDRLLKELRAGDLWLHAQKYHSAHVGIFAEGNIVPDSVIRFAAGIAAHFSDGGKGGKVAIDCCDRRFVKKPPKANPGFVLYTNFTTLLVEPICPAEQPPKANHK